MIRTVHQGTDQWTLVHAWGARQCSLNEMYNAIYQTKCCRHCFSTQTGKLSMRQLWYANSPGGGGGGGGGGAGALAQGAGGHRIKFGRHGGPRPAPSLKQLPHDVVLAAHAGR